MKIIETNWQWKSGLSRRNATKYIALHHAASVRCSAADVDRWHKNNGWSGIGYHYFVRKDGSIYRGRPEWAMGAHVSGSNNIALGICTEGNYETESVMPTTQKTAIIELVKDVLARYPNAKVVGHRDIGSSICPGKYFPRELFDPDTYMNKSKGGASTAEYKELTSVNDIVWELGHRGIITDSGLWLKKCAEDQDVYWLCRKMCDHLRRGDLA